MLESLFNKVAGFRAATLLKKETLTLVFSCKLCKLFKSTFFYRTPPVAASLIPQFADNKPRKHYAMKKKILVSYSKITLLGSDGAFSLSVLCRTPASSVNRGLQVFVCRSKS